jgi:hypothetical protein
VTDKESSYSLSLNLYRRKRANLYEHQQANSRSAPVHGSCLLRCMRSVPTSHEQAQLSAPLLSLLVDVYKRVGLPV